MTYSDKAAAFLAKRPALIGMVAGHTFYECPVMGDEETLYAVTPAGKLKHTCFWELPTTDELFA